MAESDVPASGNNAANTSQPSATHPRRNSSTSNNTNNNNNNSPAADEAAAIIDRFFDMFVDLSAKAEKEPVEVSLKHQNGKWMDALLSHAFSGVVNLFPVHWQLIAPLPTLQTTPMSS